MKSPAEIVATHALKFCGKELDHETMLLLYELDPDLLLPISEDALAAGDSSAEADNPSLATLQKCADNIERNGRMDYGEPWTSFMSDFLHDPALQNLRPEQLEALDEFAMLIAKQQDSDRLLELLKEAEAEEEERTAIQ
jgi:hypothetical protein